MVINELEFFSTPLDNSYKNVYDITRLDGTQKYTKEEVAENYLKIIKKFPSNFTINTGIRATKYNDKNITIIVPFSADKILDSNYVKITTAEGNKYAFIIEVNSLNDNAVSGGSAVQCEWDLWANNLYDIMYPSVSDLNHFIKRHIDQWKSDGNDIDFDIVNSDEEKPVNYKTFGYAEDSQYGILWAKYRILTDENLVCEVRDKNGNIIIGDDKYKTGVLRGVKPYNNKVPVVYFPLYIIDRSNRSLKPIKKVIINILSNPTGTKEIDIYQSDINIAALSKRVLSGELTFHCPIGNSVLSSDTIRVFSNSYLKLYEKGGTSQSPEYSNIFQSFIGCFGDFGVSGGDNYYSSYPYSKKFIVKNPSETILKESLDEIFSIPKYLKKIQHEARFLSYPFNYNSVIVSGSEIPIIPLQDTIKSIELSVSFDDGEMPRVNSPVIGLLKKPLINNGSLFITEDSMQTYYRQNANKQQSEFIRNGFNKLNASLSLSAAMKSGSPTGIISAGSNYVSSILEKGEIKAKIRDIDNLLPSSTISSSSAFEDLYFQDDIIIKKYILETNSYLTWKIVDEILYNGINFDEEDSVSVNSRILWDFKMTSNCSLPAIKNNYARYRIEEVFNNGVRVWHFDPKYDSYMSPCITVFDKRYLNLTKTQFKFKTGGTN